MHKRNDQFTYDQIIQRNVEIPQLRFAEKQPTVIPNTITTEKVTLDVTPAWFEPIKCVPQDKIRYPATYNSNSPNQVRAYDCLTMYRSMIQNSDTIDFVNEPFVSTVESTETLVVVLNELAHKLGARLTFTHSDFTYNDTQYRTACGVTDLGNIHSFLASSGQYQTAEFHLHFDLNYEQLISSSETLKKFVLTFIDDMSTISQCKKDFIRVFKISRTSSVSVDFGITTPQIDKTKEIAQFVKQKLNEPSLKQRKDLFQYLLSKSYDFHFQPALSFLQLQKSDFDPKFNRNYPDALTETRGNYSYYFPQGWYRHALRVLDKYSNDKTWLGMINGPGEWAVAYHGTNSLAVKSIQEKGLLHEYITSDFLKEEAERQNPDIPDVKGLYVATHCEGGASEYSTPFILDDSTGVKKTFQVAFQCRVQPGKFTEHNKAVKIGKAWRVFDEKAIRPYGLLLKRF